MLRQRATGCHVKGPLALRHNLSIVLLKGYNCVIRTNTIIFSRPNFVNVICAFCYISRQYFVLHIQNRQKPPGLLLPDGFIFFRVIYSNCFEHILFNRLFTGRLINFFPCLLQFFHSYHFILCILKSQMGVSIHCYPDIRMAHQVL